MPKSELDATPPPPLASEESLEDLRTLLWRTHKVTVDEHDPILMLHTIHKVALTDFQRMLDRHGRAFSDDARKAAQGFADEVRQTIEDLKSKALNDAVRERLATVRETVELTDAAQTRLRRTVRLLWALTALNYVGAALTLGVLTALTF